MSDEIRDELLRLVRQVREHAQFLERGGVVGVPRGETPASAPSAPAKAPATA